MKRQRRILGSAALSFCAALFVSCAINPVTGERELALVSEEQEIGLGREAAQQAQAAMGVVPDEELQSYVRGIGLTLAGMSERPDLPWEFHVVDESAPNAFALPGGYIFVTRGLLNLMSSEAELAAVLGHEIGHVTARHSVSQMSRAQLAQLGLGLGSILSPELARVGEAANAGLGLLFLKYGRDDERQADELGFRYMLEHGYDVREMEDVFSALLASGELAGQSGGVPSWLASHPSEPERIAAVRERIAALPTPPDGLRADADEFLQHLDGSIYGDDPRNGFFSGDSFYHPELIFEFDVPQSWQRQNLARAVAAVSPENDAALQLTLLPNVAPRDAARAFLSQQGIRPIGSAERRLNGNDAVVSEFQVALEGGAARGYVAHITHGGATYQLVTYSADSQFGRYADTLERIVTSFAPLSNAEARNVQPQRVRIERLQSDMSLAEFHRTRPSPVPIEELAVINQVADVNAQLPRGTPLKRIVGDRIE